MTDTAVLEMIEKQNALNRAQHNTDEQLFRYLELVDHFTRDLATKIGGLEESVKILQKAIRDINER